MKNKHLFVRMGFAFSGLRYAFLREKSVRFQAITTILVIAFLVIAQPNLIWWAIVFIAIAAVFAAELFNTAIEAVCDLVQPEHDERIKNIKDVAAGAVLLTSVGAIFVGVFLVFDLLG